MEAKDKTRLEVTVDKRHIVSIGERLYAESVDLFGMETWGKAVARVKGEINADFLPLTSDRSGFIVDSDEYQ